MISIFYIYLFFTSFIISDMGSITAFMIGGFNVYLIDLVYIFFFVCLIKAYKVFYAVNDIKSIYWMLFWMMFALVHGIFSFGFRALGEARQVYGLFAMFVPLVFVRDGIIASFQDYDRWFIRFIKICSVTVFILLFLEFLNGGHFSFSAANPDIVQMEDFRGVRYLGNEETFTMSVLAVYLLLKITVSNLYKPAYIVSFIVILLLVLITKNRTAPIAIFGGYLIFMLISGRYKVLVKPFILFIVTCALIYLVFPSYFKSVFDAFLGVGDLSTDETGRWRLYVQQSAILQGMETPVLGQGFGGYSWFYVPEFNKVIEFPPHSMYVSMFLKAGIIGVILYIVMLFGIVRDTIKFRKHTAAKPEYEIYRALFAVIFISQYINSLSYGYSLYFGLFVGFYLIFKMMVLKESGTSAQPVPSEADAIPVS